MNNLLHQLSIFLNFILGIGFGIFVIYHFTNYDNVEKTTKNDGLNLRSLVKYNEIPIGYASSSRPSNLSSSVPFSICKQCSSKTNLKALQLFLELTGNAKSVNNIKTSLDILNKKYETLVGESGVLIQIPSLNITIKDWNKHDIVALSWYSNAIQQFMYNLKLLKDFSEKSVKSNDSITISSLILEFERLNVKIVEVKTDLYQCCRPNITSAMEKDMKRNQSVILPFNSVYFTYLEKTNKLVTNIEFKKCLALIQQIDKIFTTYMIEDFLHRYKCNRY